MREKKKKKKEKEKKKKDFGVWKATWKTCIQVKQKDKKKKKESGKTCTCANKFVFKKVCMELHFAKIKLYLVFFLPEKSH